eukprot:SAG25_NODE_12085_length_288_cov_0.820106_1_plen_26_part_01
MFKTPKNGSKLPVPRKGQPKGRVRGE